MGRRVRRLRQDLGLSQMEMARRLGMSASYLNLIEHEQRPLTLKVLMKLGETFNIDLNAFSARSDAGRLAELQEIIADPLFRDRALGDRDLADLVDAAPGMAAALIDLYRIYRLATDEVERLREDLHGREVTAGLAYDVRTLLTTIRSFSEILRDNPDLDTGQRRRFLDILIEDSKRLVPLVGSLVDGQAAAVPALAPVPETTDFLQSRMGYVAELEEAADGLCRTLGIASAHDLRPLIDALTRAHGVRVDFVDGRVGGYDEERRHLAVPEMLSPAGRAVVLARCLVRVACRSAIDRCLDPKMATTPDVEALIDYGADALLMPYDAFLAAAKEFRYDIERLRRRFAVGYERVCRRLATLQRAGARGVPLHLLEVDIAGNVLRRFSASGIRIARFAGVCPLWNVHRAFMTPGTIRTQLSSLPDGTAYLSVARTVEAEEPPSRDARLTAVEIGCEISFAGDLVYADGLDLGNRDRGFASSDRACRVGQAVIVSHRPQRLSAAGGRGGRCRWLASGSALRSRTPRSSSARWRRRRGGGRP